MLPDEDRRRIGAALPEAAPGLPTATERLAERRHALAATLAGLRGQVTLSYPAWNPGEARRVDPTATVLQAFRVREGNPTLDYDKLRTSLGRLCGPVPRGGARLDASDVWLASLRGGAAPVDGTAQVREAFKGLGAGFSARHAIASSEPTPHHGVVTPQPERWDPRLNRNLFVSASRLETLGRCPHQYLLKYVLRVRIPDGSAGPDVWLAPNHRGTLLHDVFDLTLTEARDKGIAPTSPDFAELALSTLESVAEATRAELAPPSELVFLRELEDMRRDVQVWVASMNEADVEWVECEMEFGPGKRHPAVSVPLPGGTFRILGAIDRVDRLPGGKLRIVDYKTGSPAKYGRETGVFDGGRRLQHFVYSRAAEALLGAPVDRMEYRFPTERGQNGRRAFASADLEPAAEMLDGLLDLVTRGHFLPTEEKNDCRFCDYKNVCRTECDDRGNVLVAPLADWAAAHAEGLDVYAPLLRARSVEG
jgi:ATP-dependent helicase/nuclease subunit B